MARWLRLVVLLTLGGVLLGACGTPASGQGSNVLATQTREAELTQVASVKATASAPAPTVTLVPTATMTIAPTIAPTQTMVPFSKSAAKYLDPRYLGSDPYGYQGRNISFRGKALTVEQRGDYTWLHIQARSVGTAQIETAIVVELRPADRWILSSECYRIFGIPSGTQQVTRTATGATNTVPLVLAYAYEKSSADKYGNCYAVVLGEDEY